MPAAARTIAETNRRPANSLLWRSALGSAVRDRLASHRLAVGGAPSAPTTKLTDRSGVLSSRAIGGWPATEVLSFEALKNSCVRAARQERSGCSRSRARYISAGAAAAGSGAAASAANDCN